LGPGRAERRHLRLLPGLLVGHPGDCPLPGGIGRGRLVTADGLTEHSCGLHGRSRRTCRARRGLRDVLSTLGAGEPGLRSGRHLLGLLTGALLIAARHHRDGAGWNRRRVHRRRGLLADLAGLNVAARLARRAERGRLDTRLIGALRDRRYTLNALRTRLLLLLRAGLRGGLTASAGGGLFRVRLAHNGGKVELFDLRGLVPGMLTGRALQCAAFLP